MICNAGKAYLDFVVPHFEFMLSRHDTSTVDAVTSRNLPLFMDDNIQRKIKDAEGNEIYPFEKTIRTVYEDVHDCSFNAAEFAYKIEEYKGVPIKGFRVSQYNYRPIDRNNVPGDRQSYASRLVFRHVGYIDKYRLCLLRKHSDDAEELRADVNKHIIGWIEKYLDIYDTLGKEFQSPDQDEAMIALLEQIDKIKKNDYKDFNTRIEVKNEERRTSTRNTEDN